MESEMWKGFKKSMIRLFSHESFEFTQNDEKVDKVEKKKTVRMGEKIKNKKKDTDEACKFENEGVQKVKHTADKEKMKCKEETRELKNKGKLFVGGLHYQTTSKGLEDYFSQFGKVIDAVVMRFPDTGRSRGFGFVMFAQASDAEYALRTDCHILDGKSIDVRPFVSAKAEPNTPKNDKDHRVFLGGLPENISSDMLKQFFGRYGGISKISIPVDKKTKKSKGFGFLSFESKEAVEKCLAEEFVHLGGRRIHIRRAEPRSRSHAPDALEIGEDCLESDVLSSEDLIFLDNMSNFSVGDIETTSTTSGERSEEDFSSKWSSFNAMYKTETEEGKRDFKELLADFLASYNEECSSSKENLISLSEESESEEPSSGTHSDCDSDDGDNGSGADAEMNTNALVQLSTEFMKVLSCSPSVKGSEISGLNNAEGGDRADFQTSSYSQFINSKGSLFCSVCQWAPENNSCESFLNHCKTAGHKNKLKERFPKEQQCQAARNNEESKQRGEKQADIKQKPLPQKPVVEQGVMKSQGKIQTQAREEKQNQTEQEKAAKTKTGKKAKKATKKGKEENKNTPGNSKPEKDKNDTVIKNNLKGLKIMALAKGMSCIRPDSNQQLKCTMCNKIIPKAEDFNVVMKNVTQHLQSKLHLKKMLETEISLKESLEKKQNDSKSCEPVKNPAGQKTQSKASSQQQKVAVQGNAVKNAGTTKKSQNKSSDAKLLFLCVPCNYFNKNIETFKAHLKSEAHLDCFISRGVSTDLSFDNLTKCNTCELLLYGSQYYINKHYNKCSEKKT